MLAVEMEITILAVCVILCSIPLVSGTTCINNCFCEEGKCSTCNVMGFSETIQCKKCPFGCLSCQGQNLDICTACAQQHVLRNGSCFPCPTGCETCEYVEQQQVRKTCGRGYYLNRGICTSCLSQCQNCTSLNDCKDCNEFCISCASNCVSCTSFFNCQICKPQYYGESCEKICSKGCKESMCNKQDGHCSCEEGWHGQMCDTFCPESCQICSPGATCNTCKPGYYGYLCKNRCSIGCFNDLCNKNTGECKCSDNFEGEHCQGCVSGKYGFNCSDICPSTCRNNVCHQLNGDCLTGCIPGMFGTKCENSCPASCELCTSNISCLTCKTGYRGKLCSLKCPYGCNGSCYPDGTCIACAEGYYGNLCNVSCPEHCNGSQCNQTGYCYDCAYGYYGYQCKQPCSSHCCNGTCSRHGTCKLCNIEERQSCFEAQIGWISVSCLLAVLTFLMLVYNLLLQRSLAHKDSILNSIYTGTANLDTNTADLEMATFLPGSEGTLSSDQNQQSAVYELPRNTTTSDTDNGEDVSADISTHVYSGPYELPLELSGENTSIAQRIYNTPTDGHYQNVAGADGTDRETRQYEHLTSELTVFCRNLNKTSFND